MKYCDLLFLPAPAFYRLLEDFPQLHNAILRSAGMQDRLRARTQPLWRSPMARSPLRLPSFGGTRWSNRLSRGGSSPRPRMSTSENGSDDAQANSSRRQVSFADPSPPMDRHSCPRATARPPCDCQPSQPRLSKRPLDYTFRRASNLCARTPRLELRHLERERTASDVAISLSPRCAPQPPPQPPKAKAQCPLPSRGRLSMRLGRLSERASCFSSVSSGFLPATASSSASTIQPSSAENLSAETPFCMPRLSEVESSRRSCTTPRSHRGVDASACESGSDWVAAGVMTA